jgi:hypothetical protein
MRTKAVATVLIAGTVLVFGCQALNPGARPAYATLRTDSAEVSVRHHDFSYSAEIGFVYTNTTAKPVSRAVCGPVLPGLEKKIDGKWVDVYSPVSLACRIIPDFTLASGAVYHGVLDFQGFEPGHNYLPTINLRSIDGIYRLRLDFTEGTDPMKEGARQVKATSNEFHMTERGR